MKLGTKTEIDEAQWAIVITWSSDHVNMWLWRRKRAEKMKAQSEKWLFLCSSLRKNKQWFEGGYLKAQAMFVYNEMGCVCVFLWDNEAPLYRPNEAINNTLSYIFRFVKERDVKGLMGRGMID